MVNRNYAIGIDLGTSNSCVAVHRNGRVHVIANEQGQRLTPSFVTFTDEEILIGDSAKFQRSMNPRNTIYEIKRLIGRKFTDKTVQKCMKQWSFRVEERCGNPIVNVQHLNVEKQFTPEEISAMVLEKMKEIAEIYLGCEVEKAVITVPAYFTEAQRQATIDAGTIAGLEVLKIINEPTAAAIAYGEEAEIQENRNILIFDFGGGTFDVSILTIKGKEYEVKATNGNSNLGGADLDTRFSEHLLREFLKKTGLDASRDPKALSKVRTAAELSKIRLSTQLKDRIQIESLYRGKDLDLVITRTKFEQMCEDLFKETITCVDHMAAGVARQLV
ncbi:Heat shock protein 70 family [Trinorchestia longiramus]|nr:Heat shock protein 70 family [Trinorchestia longiramus]